VADVVVIGVGNRMMGDDAVGPIVMDQLSGRLPKSVMLVESVGDATHLLDTWRDARLTVIVDAVVSGGVPGSIQRIDGKMGLPPSWHSASTHLIGVVEAIDLGGAVDMLPDELVVYGIEIGKVAPGVNLSPEVESAVDQVVGMIVTELSAVGSR
jgi:hydrogenase maturation protease